MKIVLTITAILFSTLGFSQKTDTLINKNLLKELAESACKCADTISVYNKEKAEIAKEISKCISDQTGAYQIGWKLMNIEAYEKDSVDKDGTKHVTIPLNMDEGSEEYERYYFEMERYLMANCKTVRDKIATSDIEGSKSYSSNTKSFDLYSKGLEKAQQGNCQKAITYYKKALEIDPEFAFAWDNMGLCYRQLEQYDKALVAYQKSLEIDPNGLMPLQNIAIVYQYQKEYHKAIEAYQKLSKLDQNNPEVYYGIGNIYATGLLDFERGLSNMCKAYNLYIAQKSPYRSDAEKVINIIYNEMRKQGKEERFLEILKANNIRFQ